ncbi:MAG: Ig-like domain-containing protein, partial [Bacteroidia bacterium]
MKNIIHLLFLFIFNISGIIFGQSIIYVNSATGNDSGNGSFDSPYKTFHKGYLEAASGDTINLTGTFTWTNAEETGDAVKTGYTINKDITIIGQSPDETIIQADTTSGTANMRVFTVANSVDNFTIKNVTIQNGHLSNITYNEGGAGIHFSREQTNQTVLIYNCIIKENHNNWNYQATQWAGGGALWIYNTRDNDNSTLTVRNTTISNNSSNNQGATIWAYTNSNSPLKIKFEGCTISNNVSNRAGNIYAYYSWMEFINCTLAYNSSYYYLIDSVYSGELNIINSTIAYNENTYAGQNFPAVYARSNGGGDYGVHNLFIKNSIITDNHLTETGTRDLQASNLDVESISYSAIKSESSTAVDGQNGNIVGFITNPVESSLEYNGSANRQKSLKLTSTSIAIDTGDDNAINNITIPEKDQRSYLRSGTIDMGAVELTELTDLKTQNVIKTSFVVGGNMYDRALGFSSDGNYLAVGSKGGTNDQGQVYVYKWNSNDEEYELLPITIDNEGLGLNLGFGNLVVFNQDGSKLWISDNYYNNFSGKVYQYNNSNDTFTLETSYTGGGNQNDYFGNSISVSDEGTLAIGEPGFDGFGTPPKKVYVYDLDAPANNFNFNSTSREFGKQIDLSSDANYLAISSSLSEKVEVRQAVRDVNGIIIRYDLVGSAITKPNTSENSFGRQVQISDDGKKLVVASPSQNTLSGAIYFYTYEDGSGWSLTQSIKNPEYPSTSYFGGQFEMDKSGKYLMVAASSGASNGAGEIYLFSYNSNTNNFEFNRSFQADGTTQFGHNIAISKNGSKAAFTNYKGMVIGGDGGSIYTLNIADTISPTLSITKSPDKINNSNNATITFTFDEEVIGFVEDDITLFGGGTKSNFSATSSSVYTLSYTPPTNSTGTVTFTVNDNIAQDLSGNFNVSSTLSFQYDTISPTLSSFTHDHDDLIVNGDETVLLTATFSENMTSTPTISIGGIVNDVINEEMTSTSSSVWTFSWNVPSAKNGDFSATVSGTDLFGNYYAGTDSITFDVDN